ncbi:hypothetical protein [Actinomadura napierensis]|uniref:Uncharacterized protein n=1 Tax=Actinomadura napierensis TaxID=267854 RepID=A0ABP5LLB5_9ACTN
MLRLVIALSTAEPDGLQARDAFLAERSRQLHLMLARARDRLLLISAEGGRTG